jgi:MFS family permease
MTWPYAEYAIKEYSSKDLMNLTNSCFFMSNYLAGIIIGLVIDSMWIFYDDKSFVYHFAGVLGIFFLCLAAVFLFFCRDLKNMDNEDLEAEGLWKLKRFWRFVLLIFLLILLRSSSFGHLDATLPKYLTRVKGDQAHFGIMLAIHSSTMMIGLFVLTGLTYKYSSYTLIVIGSFLGSLASVFIIFSDELAAFILFVVCISIGESIWVPRLLDYTYAIAPEGKEGIYLAMSNCPFYFGMILTGGTSGSLLGKFCSNDVEIEDCSKVWNFVFLGSSFVSILLVVFRRTILGPPHENYDKLVCFRDNKKA